MVTILAILGWFSWMVSIPALIGLLLLGTIFEHNKSRGKAIFTGIVAMAISYFVFNVPLLYIVYAVVGFLFIGLIFSFYRYKRHAGEVVESVKGGTATEKEYAIRKLHPTAMLGTITAWILIWPFSLLENLIGDIINFVQNLVQKVFRGVYYRIYESAVSQLK